MVFCTNCQTEIEDSKIFLHEGFCKKNIKYCFQCKEKIPIEEYEEHLENHNTKKSEQEEETEPNNEIYSEKNKKDGKILNQKSKEDINIECQYCSLLVDPSEIEEHEKMCGARTVQCEICGKFIHIRLIKQHMNVIHDMGYRDIYNDNEGNENENEQYKKECEKRKQIENDELLARKLAEEYRNYDLFNSRRYF